MESEIVCKPKSFYLNFGTNVFVHILFLFTILTTLFIFVISKISSNAINSEITDLVNKNINNKIDKLSQDDKKNLKKIIDELNLSKLTKLYEKEDKVRKYNNKFVNKTMIISVILLVIILLFIIVISKLLCHKLPLKHILVDNFIIFTGVGIVEFLFFKYIILKYIPIKPSFLSIELVNTIKKTIF
jgi:thiosulfate reductase cytochrome b subunit